MVDCNRSLRRQGLRQPSCRQSRVRYSSQEHCQAHTISAMEEYLKYRMSRLMVAQLGPQSGKEFVTFVDELATAQHKVFSILHLVHATSRQGAGAQNIGPVGLRTHSIEKQRCSRHET